LMERFLYDTVDARVSPIRVRDEQFRVPAAYKRTNRVASKPIPSYIFEQVSRVTW